MFGSKSQVDANTADPAVLAAIGITPDGIQAAAAAAADRALVTRERIGQLVPMLGPGGQMLRLEGNSIVHHPRHGACASGQRAALRHEAHRGRAGQVHAFQLLHPHPHPALVRRDVGAISPMPLDSCHLQRFQQAARLRLRRGPGNRPPRIWKSRSRACVPNKIQVLGRLTISRLMPRAPRPSGAPSTRAFPEGGGRGAPQCHGAAAAPREVIVRQIALPGVAAKDIEGAIRFQLDTLHPYGEERCGVGLVAAGLRRRAGGYCPAKHHRALCRLFVEAGDRRAQLHVFRGGGTRRHPVEWRRDTAREVRGAQPFGRRRGGGLRREPVAPAVQRGIRPGPAARHHAGALQTTPRGRYRSQDSGRDAAQAGRQSGAERYLPQCAAVCDGPVRGLSPVSLRRPMFYRRNTAASIPGRCSSRTVVLAALLLLVAGSMAVYASWSEKQYLKQINAEIAKWNRCTGAPIHWTRNRLARARARLLDQFRKQTRMDLDALNELTHLLEPPAWSNNIALARDTVRIAGETPQTAPLLKILDASPLFEKHRNPDVRSPLPTGETFQIRTNRAEGQMKMDLGTLERKTAIL